MDTNLPVISLKGICFAYTKASPVFNNLDFKFYRGGRIGLVAPNGSGKTTLFHIIRELLKYLDSLLKRKTIFLWCVNG